MITFADEAALTVLVQDVPTNIIETTINMALTLLIKESEIKFKW